MKRSTSLIARQIHSAPRRGVALLLVLSCLVLLAALILGFLLSGQNNLKSSKLFANGSSVKTLADSTVSLVMGQIQQATSNGTQVAWASQPGMIRTYGSDGLPKTNYRLYSWDSPTIPGATDPSADATSITGNSAWYNSPALFFDLNQPVSDSAGNLHYPIVDGNPTDLGNPNGGTSNYTTVTGSTVSTYPMTVSGATVPAIEGFWVNLPNTQGGPSVNPTTTAGSTTPSNMSNNLIPMPVKWLYVLKDGTIVTPSGVAGTQVTVTGASSDNPIVGRMAYWTDDETSKVNINTASEGAFWDTPRAQGATDFNLATMQPAQNEYQRYPGHPATTSLSTIFGSLSPSLTYVDPTLIANNVVNSSIVGSASYTPYKFYYDLAPKLNADNPTNLGSQAGTARWYLSGDPTATVPNGTSGYLLAKGAVASTGTTTGVGSPTTGGDRLYASIDELLFASNLFTDSAHTASATVTGSGTPANRPLTSAMVNQPLLEEAKFFITANSRAPDVNMFNQPRIVCWPVNSSSGADYQTTLDTAIAWCGTENSKNKYPYYFTRSRNDHPTNDLPSTTATSGLGRNRMLINYLDNLTSLPIPGFSASATSTFLTKYPSASGGLTSPTERDQIITEIFDYIRCLNLQDGSSFGSTGTSATNSSYHQFAPPAYTPAPYNYSTQYAYPYPSSTPSVGIGGYWPTGSFVPSFIGNAGAGQVVPIYDMVTQTKGFGRFPTVSEISIMLICTGWNDGKGGYPTTTPWVATPNGTDTTCASDPNFSATTAAIAYTGTSTPSGTYGFTTTTTGTLGWVTTVSGTATTCCAWGYYNDGTNGHPATGTPSATGIPATTVATLTGTGPKFTVGQMAAGSSTANTIPGGTATVPAAYIQVQPVILVSMFDPSAGFVQEDNTFSLQLSGISQFTWPDGTAMFSPSIDGSVSIANGVQPIYAAPTLTAYNNTQYTAGWGGMQGFRRYYGGAGSNYKFVGTAHNFTYDPSSATTSNMGSFSFGGGDIAINVLLPSAAVNLNGDSHMTTAARAVTPAAGGGSPWQPTGWPLGVNDSSPLQTIKVTFPPISAMPLPYFCRPGLNSNGVIDSSGSNRAVDRGSIANRLCSSYNAFCINNQFTYPGDVIRSVRAVPGDIRMIAGKVLVVDTAGASAASPGYFDPKSTKIQASGLSAWDYFNTSGTNAMQVHSFIDSLYYPLYGAILGQLVPGIQYANQPSNNVWPATTPTLSCGAGGSPLATGAVMTNGIAGDWDNGFGYTSDGSYINKPDEGDTGFYNSVSTHDDIVPYFGASSGWAARGAGTTYFSPNRLMPSPGMFGSLSTGVIRNQPWMTLLFCPNPSGGPLHPGFGKGAGTQGPLDIPPYTTVPDYLWLDFFNMPVVEPYPISEPLSTAGRVNMNYQIMPFTYIERSTGVRAVLKSERITAISDKAANVYKTAHDTGASYAGGWDFRLPINLDQTLTGFDNYFTANKDIFRSAAQICNMYLYPTRDANGSISGVPTWDKNNVNINTFWYGVGSPTGAYTVSPTTSNPTHFLTGDNSRERPYTNIYPRLTTKSNTFTVHYCVETLKKVTSAVNQGIWDEATDQVTGQYRGSTTVERYVDPNDITLPDFAATANYGTALDAWYKFRVVSTKQFAP